MSGETNLNTLIKDLSPELHSGEFVFCTPLKPTNIPPEQVIGSFRELEGDSLLLSRQVAEAYNLPYEGLMAWITLNVHSSLQAVGLTAAVSSALTAAGISCNVVAAYYHDHLFVPIAQAAEALDILRALSRTSS